MTTYSILEHQNKVLDSRTFNDSGLLLCPVGHYVNEIKIRGRIGAGITGPGVTQICPMCSDGTELNCIGGTSGTVKKVVGPFKGIDMRVSNRGRSHDNPELTSLFGVGNTWGNEGRHPKCGDDKVLRGIYAKYGWDGNVAGKNKDKGKGFGTYIYAVGGVCDRDARKVCVENLEDPMCQGISRDVLNKACKLKFTATCNNRRDELDENFMQNYCKTHINDKVCACYKPPPTNDMAQNITAMPTCWNRACVTYGYIPPAMRKPTCPNIKVCNQWLPTSGAENILTDNVQYQDCSSHDTIVPGENASPTDAPVGGGGTAPVDVPTNHGDESTPPTTPPIVPEVPTPPLPPLHPTDPNAYNPDPTPTDPTVYDPATPPSPPPTYDPGSIYDDLPATPSVKPPPKPAPVAQTNYAAIFFVLFAMFAIILVLSMVFGAGNSAPVPQQAFGSFE